MATSENSTRKEIVTRMGIVYVGIVIFGLLVVTRIVYLQVVEHDKWISSNNITPKDITIEPDRGDILAHDGRLLATSVPYYEVRWDTHCDALTNSIFNKHIDSLALGLSSIFRDKSAQQYKSLLVKARYRGDRYLLIKRRVDFVHLKRLKRLPIFRLGQYKGGLIVIQENLRVQPFNDLASRTIGYQGKGGTTVGIEGAFDEDLSGEKGVRLVQRIAGNYWMPVSDGNEVEPRNGYDVISTLDINLQDVAHDALKDQLQRHGASHGVAILMEVETGDIKAMVNLKKEGDGYYSEQFNYAIGERTEPGSTFKLASLMVALEDGYIELNDMVETGKGSVKYHDIVVKDTKEEGYGKISVKQVFEYSSNVGVSKIITKNYKGNEEKFVKGLKRMSLTEGLDLAIKGERPPYIKFPDDKLWSGVSLAQMSYGYEVEQTPLQILTFYNAVANDGKMMKPRFVKGIADHGEMIKTFSPEVINSSICSRSTIKKAKMMLEGVVEKGTAQNLRNANYKIAGKTGTAQIANKKYGYKYNSQTSYQASFAGYFPADNPKYSCIVIVNAPSSGVYYGNLVAGQVFKEISDKVYATQFELHDEMKLARNEEQSIPYTRKGSRKELELVLDELDIPTEDLGVNSDWVITEKQKSAVRLHNRYITDNLVPDVVGMGAKDALYILENMGLRVIIRGRGAVTSQSIGPGNRIQKGDKIYLKLG
jgi:cell division protein FtsI (penicillin-binding protein 3)